MFFACGKFLCAKYSPVSDGTPIVFTADIVAGIQYPISLHLRIHLLQAPYGSMHASLILCNVKPIFHFVPEAITSNFDQIEISSAHRRAHVSHEVILYRQDYVAVNPTWYDVQQACDDGNHISKQSILFSHMRKERWRKRERERGWARRRQRRCMATMSVEMWSNQP